MDPLFTTEQLLEVKAYHAPGYVFGLIQLAAWPAILAVLARYGTRPMFAWASRLTRGLRSAAMDRVWRGEGWAPSLAFAVSLFVLLGLISLPADLWFGWFHEHEHGLSRTTPGVFAVDMAKAWALEIAAVSALVVGVFGLARRFPAWWLIVGAVGAGGLAVSALVDPYRNQVYVTQRPLSDGPLKQGIAALMARANIQFEEVRVEETSSRTVRLQAYFAGTGPTQTIVLNDSLVSELTEAEVLAAVAHEAGHVGEPRWPRLILSSLALLAWLGVIEWVFRRSAARGWFGVTQRADVRTLPLLLLVFDLAMTVASPISAAVSRSAETKADAYAVALTQDPDAFASMLTKAARINKMDPSPPPWVRLWQSHPPISERLAAVHRGAR